MRTGWSRPKASLHAEFVKKDDRALYACIRTTRRAGIGRCRVLVAHGNLPGDVTARPMRPLRAWAQSGMDRRASGFSAGFGIRGRNRPRRAFSHFNPTDSGLGPHFRAVSPLLMPLRQSHGLSASDASRWQFRPSSQDPWSILSIAARLSFERFALFSDL
jgi:hypothetical protein